MTVDDKIRDEKLQYDINRKAAQISALSSGKIDKYTYVTGEETQPSDQRRVIEQAKFTYSSLRKALEKQTKTTEDQAKKQIKAIKDHGKQLVESNELVKKDFNVDRGSMPHDKQKEIFNELIREKSSEFRSLENIKILTSKQMLQRLPIALAQLKAGNISENLLSEIRQIIYFLYRGKDITKKYMTI